MADKSSQKRKRENKKENSQDGQISSGSDTDPGNKKAKILPCKDEMKKKFKVDMPSDFYDFWEFCKELDPDGPKDALRESIGLQLVGPYDVLSGGFTGDDNNDTVSYHLHWRYYYDPPEFMTVMRGDDKEGYHIGYFRDDPKELPAFVASNKAKASCEFSTLGENLFSAVSLYLTNIIKKTKDKSKQSSLKKLQSSLSDKAKELKYNLLPSTSALKARNKKVNSKTFHKAGIVVPVDATEVGYRPLTVTDGELRKMLKTITAEGSSSKAREEASDSLQEVLTFVQLANDECDYGMGLELGLDLFSFGHKRFHNTVLQLLPLAYQLLGRDEYGEIISVHLEHRDRDSLSQIK